MGYKQKTFNGDAEKVFNRLRNGSLRPDQVRRDLGMLRSMGIKERTITSYLGGETVLKGLGLKLDTEVGRLYAVPEERGPAKPKSLIEKAVMVGSVISKKTASPQYDTGLLNIVKPQHGAPVSQKRLNDRLRGALARNDAREAAEIVDMAPAVNRAILSKNEYRGRFIGHYAQKQDDARVRTTAEIASAGEWSWASTDDITQSHSWVGVSLDNTLLPTVRRISTLGTLRRNRLELRDFGNGRPRPVHYDQEATLSREDWFLTDDTLTDLFGRDATDLPHDIQGVELKPDEVAEFDSFVTGQDELVAPSIGFLVVSQSFTPSRLQ